MSGSQTIVATRRQLHGVAESFLAGPQYRAAGTIRLAVRRDGFTATAVPVAVHGTSLVWSDGSAPLVGPVRDLVAASGLDVGPPPTDLYHSVAALDLDTVLDIDAGAADLLYRALYAGGFALTTVLAQGHPVLWPEHLDVAATQDEVNYGVSAGDDGHAAVRLCRALGFRRQPAHGVAVERAFGALYPLDADADINDLAAEIADFFRAAQAHL